MKKTAKRLLAVPNVVGMEKVQAANEGKVSITSIAVEENDGKKGSYFQ